MREPFKYVGGLPTSSIYAGLIQMWPRQKTWIAGILNSGVCLLARARIPPVPGVGEMQCVFPFAERSDPWRWASALHAERITIGVALAFFPSPVDSEPLTHLGIHPLRWDGQNSVCLPVRQKGSASLLCRPRVGDESEHRKILNHLSFQ